MESADSYYRPSQFFVRTKDLIYPAANFHETLMRVHQLIKFGTKPHTIEVFESLRHAMSGQPYAPGK